MTRSNQVRLAATAMAVSLATGASCLPSGAAEKNPLRLVSGARTERLLESVPARASAMAGELMSFVAFLVPAAAPEPSSILPTPRPEPDSTDLLRTALVEIGRSDTPFDYVLKSRSGPKFEISKATARAVAAVAEPAPVLRLEDAMGALATPLPSPFVERFLKPAEVRGTRRAEISDGSSEWLRNVDAGQLEAMLVPEGDRPVRPDAILGDGVMARFASVEAGTAMVPWPPAPELDPARFGETTASVVPAGRLFTLVPAGKAGRLPTRRVADVVG